MITRKLIDDILKSYEEIGKTNTVSETHVPARQEIKEILALIQDILFPGYFSSESIPENKLTETTIQNCENLIALLSKKIFATFRWQAFNLNQECDEYTLKENAKSISESFIEYIPKLRKMLSKDIVAFFEGDPACYNHSEVILAYPGFQAIMTYRIASFFWSFKVPIIPRLMTEIAHRDTGIDIHPGATIGESFFIDHGTGVVIGETAAIGNHVKLYQGVTLGSISVAKDMAQKKRHPTVKDYVTIYANTAILGGETEIGEHSIIGGNLWIIESIPPNSTMYRLAGNEQVLKPRKQKEQVQS